MVPLADSEERRQGRSPRQRIGDSPLEGDKTGMEGPFPLAGDFVDAVVADSDDLLVLGGAEDGKRVLYRIPYSEVDDLAHPPEPDDPRGSGLTLLVIVAVLVGVVALIFYLGREESGAEDDV